MNEDFIRQFQKMPDPVLLKKIHVRLERKERQHRIMNYSTRSLISLIFVFGLVLIFSSTIRARALQTIEQVQALLCKKLKAPCTGNGVLTPEQGLNVPLEYLFLSDAQSRFTSPIVLPKYMPQGFERLTDVGFFDSPSQPTLVITWNHPKRFSLIKLLISQNSFEIKEYAETLGKGVIEESAFDGKPALIIHGVWNIGEHDRDFVMTALMWRYDGNTVYALMSLEQAIPLDELIRMAESIP